MSFAVSDMSENEAGDRVQLYVYDLSQGFAALVSQALLGKHVSSPLAYVTSFLCIAYGIRINCGSPCLHSLRPSCELQ